MTPASIGRYQVFARLGQGGFATVYRAYDPRLDREVAVKVLHPSLAGNPRMRGRFLQEARALARVRHPHLVRLFDAGEADGMVYLTMEFLSGRSLDALAQDGPLRPEDAVRMLAQVAGALDALHAAGLVHRDVKPANIMITDDGRAVLVDLGVARSLDAGGVTTSSTILGTPGFLAPEQVSGGAPAGPRTDVYQLAATAYTLLAGRPPFEGSPAEALYAIAHRSAPDLGAVRPDLPAAMVTAIAGAMAKNPDRRPASAGALAAILEAAIIPPTMLLPQATPDRGAVSVTAHSSQPAGARAPAGERVMVVGEGPAPRRARRGRAWVAAVAAAALLLFGGTAMAVTSSQAPGPDAGRVTFEGKAPDAAPQPSPNQYHRNGGAYPMTANPGPSGPRPASYR
jgi:serine/threonine protein kinase